MSLLIFAACQRAESGSEATNAANQKIAAKVTTPSTPGAVALAAPSVAQTPPADPQEKSAEKSGEASCGNQEMAGGECKGGCNQWDEKAAEVGKREVPGDAEWSTLKVTGMSCGGCERRIVANLGTLDGVVAVEADAELGQVRVAFAKGKQSLDNAVSAINRLGYQAAQ